MVLNFFSFFACLWFNQQKVTMILRADATVNRHKDKQQSKPNSTCFIYNYLDGPYLICPYFKISYYIANLTVVPTFAVFSRQDFKIFTT